MELSRRRVLLAASVPPLLATCRTEPTGSTAERPAPPRDRDVARLVPAMHTSDGAGVKLRRSLGARALPMLDPFLMLDEIRTDRPDEYVAGFPDHPHRGFETVTYMIDGAMEHADSIGNRGRLGPGSVQWMTAGRGIVHSEMPKQERGLLWGFQLWVNLPSTHKMTKPRYQDIAPARIPEVAADGATIRVVAGELDGKTGPVDGVVTAPRMLDVKLAQGGRFRQPLPADHNAFLYVLDGAVRVGPSGTAVAAGTLAVLGPGEAAALTSDEGGRALLLSGKPIGEPVARYGPFVMNTDEEIRRAIEDYRSGRLVQGT